MAKSDPERLRIAIAKVAKLVLEDEVYMPVFIRLEAEIAATKTMDDDLSRARSIAALHNARA
ncbi:hypothetical protein [Pseudogemmobacter sp. W21_MBD1_M6]|uniref:hypothetical protein n=1 Tax=Pseudogemmobacter sp. W21_MBD1_M6 TaxID=3240271 RepID=UPI003F9864AA